MEELNSSESLESQVEDIIKNTSSLREVTYSYLELWDNKYFNETIFIDYLGLPNSLKNEKTFFLYMEEKSNTDQGFFQRIKIETETKLNRDIGILREYFDTCSDDKKTQIELLIAALELTKNAIDFELEAAGFEHNLSEEEIIKKEEKQEELDELLFGEHVSKNVGYMQDTYAYTTYLLDTFGNKVSPEQKEIIQKGLEKIENQIGEVSGEDFNPDAIKEYKPESKNEDFEKLKNIKISREDYMQIFDYFFEVGGVRQRSVLGNYSSFYDGDDAYGIPREGYETKTLQELLLLGPHETGHYINLDVTDKEGGGKRKGDMLKEEGLAKLTEKFISGVPLESMNYMTFSGPSVVLARLMDGDEYELFQGAFLHLAVAAGETGAVGNIKQKTLRKKRGGHKKRPSGSNKDVSYSLGLKMVLDYVRDEGGSVAHLFGGKISMDDVKEGTFTPHDFGNKHIQHILLSELIFFYLGSREKIKKEGGDFHNEFIAYLKEKYKELSDSFGLFNEAEKFVRENKKKVVQILKIIEKSSK